MFIKLLEKSKYIKSNKLLSGSLIYLVFSIVSQIIGLLYTTILTKNLSLSGYGEYSLVIMAQSILSIFLTLSIVSGFSRFYNEVTSKNKLFNSVINFLFIFGSCIFPIIFFFSDSISILLLGEIENGGAYVILISILAITIGISSVYETSYSMQFKPFKACLINFVGIIFRILIVFYFVNFSVIDVEKIIKSQIVISLLILFVLFALNIKHFKAEIDWVILKPVLKFGTGLMLGSVSVWIITLIDRRFLAEYSGLEDVAVYSLASTIGMLITPVFLLPFRKIFTPFKLKVYNQAGARLKIQCFYEVYCFLGVFCVLGLSLYAKFFVWLLGTNDYSAAINIIPLIAISYFLWGLNEFYGLGLIIGNKSLINSGLVTITAILNIILNFMLIPSYGVMGAAFATIISYLLTNVLYFQFSKKYYDGQIKFLSWFKFIIVYVLIYVIYLSIEIEIITEFFVNILLAISYLLICYHFKLIKKEQFLRVKI